MCSCARPCCAQHASTWPSATSQVSHKAKLLCHSASQWQLHIDSMTSMGCGLTTSCARSSVRLLDHHLILSCLGLSKLFIYSIQGICLWLLLSTQSLECPMMCQYVHKTPLASTPCPLRDEEALIGLSILSTGGIGP